MTKQAIRRTATGDSLNASTLAEVSKVHPKAKLIDLVFTMVSEQVHSGQLVSGKRIASVRQLAEACQISRDTATKAYDKLVAHGVLEARPGSGYYVTSHKPTVETKPMAAVSRRPTFAPNSLAAQMVASDGLVDTSLGGAQLPDEWLESSGIGAALRQVTKGNLRYLHRFSGVLGYLPLREQLRVKLRDIGVTADLEQVMVTQGAAEAHSLIVTANLREPGQHVLVESPGPFMIRERLAASGLDALDVERQADGPNIDQLRALCELHRPRFFFCNSVIHNPTSSSIAAHKAFQILRLAEEFDLTIVEDDTYGDLASPARASQFSRLATLDHLRRVIYVGSFSKTVGAGVRVGFVAASRDALRWLALYRHTTMMSSSSLNERAVYQVLSTGNYRYHCEALRSKLDTNRELTIRTLENIGLVIPSRHESGMYVWAALPEGVNAEAVGKEMFGRGYLTAPGQVFSYGEEHRHFMRFNVASTVGSLALPVLEAVIRQMRRVV